MDEHACTFLACVPTDGCLFNLIDGVANVFAFDNVSDKCANDHRADDHFPHLGIPHDKRSNFGPDHAVPKHRCSNNGSPYSDVGKIRRCYNDGLRDFPSGYEHGKGHRCNDNVRFAGRLGYAATTRVRHAPMPLRSIPSRDLGLIRSSLESRESVVNLVCSYMHAVECQARPIVLLGGSRTTESEARERVTFVKCMNSCIAVYDRVLIQSHDQCMLMHKI